MRVVVKQVGADSWAVNTLGSASVTSHGVHASLLDAFAAAQSLSDGDEPEIQPEAAGTVKAAALLRGRGRFDEAIQVVEAGVGSMDPDLRGIAYREAFLAAREAGDDATAKAYAEKIAVTDPDLPSIRGWV